LTDLPADVPVGSSESLRAVSRARFTTLLRAFGSPAIQGLSCLSVKAEARGEAMTRGFASLGFPRYAFVEAIYRLRLG
jgi:hypothetical protein